MEARQVLEQLGDPINAYISSHEVLEVDHKSVSWYTIETTWRRGEQTKKKQRFKFIQEALLRVRDAKERLKLNVQLPMLPLSIIRGTSEIIRAQRASEFNAFLAATISVPQLRMLPALVLLLAPDDVGSFVSRSGGSGLASQRSPTPLSHSSSDAADAHGSHAIQSLAQLGHAGMDSTTWLSAEPSGASVGDIGVAAPPDRLATTEQSRRAGGGAAVAQPSAGDGGGRLTTAGTSGDDSANAGAGESEPAPSRQQAHSIGFQVPQLSNRFPYYSGETVVVATAPKVTAMRAALERCKAAASTLCDQVATRDATIRQQQERIARLEEELQRLRAA